MLICWSCWIDAMHFPMMHGSRTCLMPYTNGHLFIFNSFVLYGMVSTPCYIVYLLLQNTSM